jgi:hypothetical protein
MGCFSKWLFNTLKFKMINPDKPQMKDLILRTIFKQASKEATAATEDKGKMLKANAVVVDAYDESERPLSF